MTRLITSALVLLALTTLVFGNPAEVTDDFASYLRTGVSSEYELGPEPERSFDEEVTGVVSPGLTAQELAYLEKKPSEAFLRSAVFPGWGQRYGNRNFRGAIFSGVEVGLWAGLLLTRQAWIEGVSEYETFARQHAGVTGDPDHQYYVDIGNYDNVQEFNEAQRSQRQYADQYKSPGDFWEWDNSANREYFEEIRIDADGAKNRIYYFAGGLLLNRIVSAIEASRGLASRQDDLREKKASLSLHIGYNESTRGPGLVLTW